MLRSAKCCEEKCYHYQIYRCLKMKPSFYEKLFKKEKINYCYGFMPDDFQVICGSMVGENRRSPASTEIPVKKQSIHFIPIPPKIPDKQRIPNVFGGYRKRPVASHGLIESGKSLSVASILNLSRHNPGRSEKIKLGLQKTF